MRVVWLWILLTVVVALDRPPAMAQASEPAPVVLAASAPDFVPVPQIPERTEGLQQTLRRFSESIAAETAVAAIEGELPGIREQNARRLEQTEALLAASPTLDQLRDFEADWTNRLSALASRRQTLSRRAMFLEEEVAELGRLRELWRQSLDNARETRAPREILVRVEANLEAIAAVSQGVGERRGVVLTLLTTVSTQELEASAAVQRISTTRVARRAQIFEPDGPPLWSAIGSAESATLWSRVQESTKTQWGELLEFAASRRRAFVPVVIAFALSVLLAVYVREGMRRRIGGEHLKGSASVFERPVSVAILATAFVGAAAFPFAPSLVWDAVGVVLLVPIVRLLMPVVPETARGLLGTLAAFYLVDRLRDVIAPAEILERSVFFGEMLAALLVIGVLLGRSRVRAFLPESAPPGVAAAGLRIALGAFVVSALSNLLGYTAFAKLVGDGALGSIYLALVAYAAYRIGTTLVVVALTTSRLQWIGVLRSKSEQIVQWARRALLLLAVVFWGLGSLDSFAIRDVVLGAAEGCLSTPFEVGTVSISLGDILAFPLTLLVAFTLSRVIRSLLEEDVFPRVSLRRGIGNAVSMTVHYVLLLGGFFLALGAAGIDLGKFTLLAGAFGVGIGFGLQTVVNNFVSGLILLYERPVQVGDTIELAGLLGEVKRIGIRASTVLTFQGAEVIIPNGNLLSDQLINWTLSNNHRRVELPVGVAYGNKPSEVIEVLNRVLDREDRILRKPEPMVLFRGFGDSSLDFELRFWARDYRTYVILASDVASAVYDELEAVGITIPFPQRDLHLKSVDADVAATLRGGEDDA